MEVKHYVELGPDGNITPAIVACYDWEEAKDPEGKMLTHIGWFVRNEDGYQVLYGVWNLNDGYTLCDLNSLAYSGDFV